MKSCSVLQDHYDDERDKIVFHNTTPDLQDQDHSVPHQDQDRFFGLRPAKTDGLRPHTDLIHIDEWKSAQRDANTARWL